jgi:hypothetical protein
MATLPIPMPAVSGPPSGNSLQPPSAAPTLGQVVSGALAATTYFVKTTYLNANGETTASPESTLAVLINNVLTVASPPAQKAQPQAGADATGYNVYVSTVTGTETKQAGPIAIGTPWQEPNTGLIGGAVPPVANTTIAPGLTDRTVRITGY